MTQPEICKYGQEPKSCTSSPMDCQCAIDAALAQPEQEPVAFDCCANCLRPKHEHHGKSCPKPYSTNWYEWDYPFAPDTTPPQRKPLTDEKISLIAHNIDSGDWNDLNFKECWHEGFKAGFREAEIEHNIKGTT